MTEQTELILNPPVDPFSFFNFWYQDAKNFPIKMPEAMCVSTVMADGSPDARMVLLRGHDQKGFQFFTNYESVKGREIIASPRAALTFHWTLQERQIRIRGSVQKTTTEESDAYWKSRPRGHRLGALSSEQSRPLENPEILVTREREFSAKFPTEDVPRPAHWGGFRVIPHCIEFWQGRLNRLHDRVCYTRDEKSGAWSFARLQP